MTELLDTESLLAHISDANRCMYELRQPVANTTVRGLLDAVRVLYREHIQIRALAQGAGGSYLFGGGWQPGSVAAADICSVIGCEPPQPPPPPTEAELGEIRAAIAEIRVDRQSS